MNAFQKDLFDNNVSGYLGRIDINKNTKPILNNIIQGDCLEVLKTTPVSSVDIVFADPPYNVKKDYGVYQDDLSEDEYKKWMKNIIKESRRIAKSGILFYVGSKLTKLFYELIPDAHLIIVHKRAVGVIQNNYFLQYHSLFSTVKPIKKTKDLWDDIRLPGEGYFFREERFDTPGLTSQALIYKIVDSFTKPNDIILDPFIGTGATAVVAKNTGRNFIGIELNPKYIELANKRVASTCKPLFI